MTHTYNTLVVVDDNAAILTALKICLAAEFERIVTLTSPDTLVATLAKEEAVDAVLLDMNFSLGVNTGQDGLFWLRTIKKLHPNTPISCISQAYMSSPAVKGTSLEEGIRAIHDTCASLNVFVDSYRKITQLQKAVITDVSLKPFFGGMSAMYADLRFSCDIEDDVTIRADENMLRQVMANLTKNAVEAGAHRMDIRLRQQDDHTDILVSNDGCPMKPEVAREVFVPFFTTKKSGSGIGLPLSRQMMMAQDGDLSLAERPVTSYSTTFILTLQTYTR